VKLRERGRGGFPYGILEDSKCVAESLQESQPQNFLIGEGEQTRIPPTHHGEGEHAHIPPAEAGEGELPD
jgi:hypothetical protein